MPLRQAIEAACSNSRSGRRLAHLQLKRWEFSPLEAHDSQCPYSGRHTGERWAAAQKQYHEILQHSPHFYAGIE